MIDVGVGVAPGHRGKHGPAQAQDLDLGVQRRRVLRGHLAERPFTRQHPPDHASPNPSSRSVCTSASRATASGPYRR
jgi:hypothetical protein